jgi:hypothetical protein
MRFINDMTRAWYVRKISPTTSSHPTPASTLGHVASDFSGPSPGGRPTPASDHTDPTFGGGLEMGGMDMSMGGTNEFGSFSFLNDPDFDMEQLFDMGIWDDASYNSMGFGAGAPF